MSNLQVVKSETFNGVQCDFYKNENDDVFMTSEQLGDSLGYSNGRKGVDNIVDRNSYLKKDEFSVTLNMRATDGKNYNTRIFTEDGIYEVTMLAKTEKAKEFRTFARNIIKALRKGEAKLIPMTDYQKTKLDIQMKNAETRLEYANLKKADMLLKIADRTKIPEYTELINSKAIEVITGTQLIPLPQAERETYSATQIGKRLGISANKVGKLANEHDLKTEEYGKLFYDKSKYSNKQVETFRYYEEVIPVFDSILKGMSA